MKTHAEKINSLYDVAASNFVTLSERLEKALSKAPFFRSQLEAVVEEFRRRNCNPPSERGWTGFGDIAQFFSQIQQSDLVFDDSLVSIKHEGYLLCVLTVWFAPPSKPVTLSISTTECQTWSELIHINVHHEATSYSSPKSTSFLKFSSACLEYS